MTSPAYAKQKGREAEKAVAEHGKSRGFRYCHRKARTGARDEGDVFVNELVQAMETKNTRKFEPSAFLGEAVVEAAHAGSPIPAGVWKVPRKPVGEWLAFMPYDALLDLLARAEFPTTDDSLWRALYTKAMDDIDALLAALAAAGVDAPYVHCQRQPEVVGS